MNIKSFYSSITQISSENYRLQQIFPSIRDVIDKFARSRVGQRGPTLPTGMVRRLGWPVEMNRPLHCGHQKPKIGKEILSNNINNTVWQYYLLNDGIVGYKQPRKNLFQLRCHLGGKKGRLNRRLKYLTNFITMKFNIYNFIIDMKKC